MSIVLKIEPHISIFEALFSHIGERQNQLVSLPGTGAVLNVAVLDRNHKRVSDWMVVKRKHPKTEWGEDPRDKRWIFLLVIFFILEAMLSEIHDWQLWHEICIFPDLRKKKHHCAEYTQIHSNFCFVECSISTRMSTVTFDSSLRRSRGQRRRSWRTETFRSFTKYDQRSHRPSMPPSRWSDTAGRVPHLDQRKVWWYGTRW